MCLQAAGGLQQPPSPGSPLLLHPQAPRGRGRAQEGGWLRPWHHVAPLRSKTRWDVAVRWEPSSFGEMGEGSASLGKKNKWVLPFCPATLLTDSTCVLMAVALCFPRIYRSRCLSVRL